MALAFEGAWVEVIVVVVVVAAGGGGGADIEHRRRRGAREKGVVSRHTAHL